GCCGARVKHLRTNDFRVKSLAVEDTGVERHKHGIPDALGGCHTGVVNGYVIEGHVPAHEIKRLLTQRPDAKGFAVPGMPAESPGMESANTQAYDVLLADQQGLNSVYARYGR